MTKLVDCEVVRRVVRNLNCSVIVGLSRLSDEEVAAMRAEYFDRYGDGSIEPVYMSGEGWQLLAEAPKPVKVVEVPKPAKQKAKV